MKPERWGQVDKLFQAALALDPLERAAFLDHACKVDAALRREVESLIAAHEQAGSFISSPALEANPSLITGDLADSILQQPIGPYRILSPIAAGGMGEVYLAQDSRLGRKVALKLLPDYFTRDEQRVRRFQQEARAASALNHPNIITIHDIGEAEGRHFIATEFVEGETLRQLMARGRMAVAESLDIAAQVASALQAAHQAGIIHRDIKPENIMLRPDGIVKVLDFGLAKLTEGQDFATGTQAPTIAQVDTDPGTVMGTATYMSPEQARGQAVDVRTDIFSLGVMIYEMLTGRPPFEGETPSDVIAAILQKDPAPLPTHSSTWPVELQAIVNQALRKARAERYQTVKELLGDLRELSEELQAQAKRHRAAPSPVRSAKAYWQSARPSRQQTISDTAEIARTGEAATVRTTSAPGSFIGLIARYQRTARWVLAVVVIALAVTIFYLWRSSKPKATSGGAIRSIAVLPFQPLGTNDDDQSLGLGLADDLVIRLSQTRQIIVRPTNVVLRLVGKEQDPVAAGRALAVDAVLTGTVRRSDDRIRVNVQFIQVEDGTPLWADKFDEKFTDILTVQDRISEQLSRAMTLELSGEAKRFLTKRYTNDAQAFELYMKARYHWKKATREGYNICIDYLQQALRKDPRYALAYTGLAGAYSGQSIFGFAPPKEAMPQAEAMAKKALELDDSLATTHSALAIVKMFYDWALADAEREVQQAIELDPNLPDAHQLYALCLAAMGRFSESGEQFQIARQLDPASATVEASAAWAAYLSRQYDQGIALCKKALELSPSFHMLHHHLGHLYAAKKMYDAAIAAYQKAQIISGNAPGPVARLAYAYAAADRKQEARKLLGELLESGAQPHFIAWVYIGLGDRERALEWLESAYDYRAGDVIYFKSDPIYDPLRSEPRFQALLRRIGPPH
jgi:serine/threonine protein kinase/TolB-like protein/Flp pilus assembly protein TadD